jgi:hypothetical protein
MDKTNDKVGIYDDNSDNDILNISIVNSQIQEVNKVDVQTLVFRIAKMQNQAYVTGDKVNFQLMNEDHKTQMASILRSLLNN